MTLIGWLISCDRAVYLCLRVAGMDIVDGRQDPRLCGGGGDIPVLANGGTAWAEQAYLRMAGIPHRVENSGHCLEPLLKDGHFMVSSIEATVGNVEH